MPSPDKTAQIEKIADLLARFEVGSIATLPRSALRLLAAAVVAHSRFPLGYELAAWLDPNTDRFAPVREAFNRLSKSDQDALCVRLGYPSSVVFRQAIACPGAEESVPTRPEDAEVLMRLYRQNDLATTSVYTREADIRMGFEMTVRVTNADLVTHFLPSPRRPFMKLEPLSEAFGGARPDWDLRIQEILHFLELLGVDPRTDAAFVTRRTTFRGGPGFLFLYQHPTMRDMVTVFGVQDGSPVPYVVAYRCELALVKARLAENLTPVCGTGPGEIDYGTPMTPEAFDRAESLVFNLVDTGPDVLRNPFRRSEILPLLEQHLRLREAVAGVLAD